VRDKPFVLILASALLFSAGGCSSFKHEWQQAALNTSSTTPLQGRWDGIWISDSNGHTDKLRCVISRKSDGTFRARFHAKYLKILSFGYTVSLNVQTNDQRLAFEGQADLGWYAGGLYHYSGWADATNFHSIYSCKYDRGTFQMTRVQ
jgi:hypothetical protein